MIAPNSSLRSIRCAACVGILACGITLTSCDEPKKVVQHTAADIASQPQPGIETCRLTIGIDPTLHRLEAQADLDIRGDSRVSPTNPTGTLRLNLNVRLGIDEITSDGKPVAFHTEAPPAAPASAPSGESNDRAKTTIYVLDWSPPQGKVGHLTLHYGGTLEEDVAAGEKPREIHNRGVHAHIGLEGIYLDDDGAWYPTLADDSPPRRPRSRAQRAPRRFPLR